MRSRTAHTPSAAHWHGSRRRDQEVVRQNPTYTGPDDTPPYGTARLSVGRASRPGLILQVPSIRGHFCHRLDSPYLSSTHMYFYKSSHIEPNRWCALLAVP